MREISRDQVIVVVMRGCAATNAGITASSAIPASGEPHWTIPKDRAYLDADVVDDAVAGLNRIPVYCISSQV